MIEPDIEIDVDKLSDRAEQFCAEYCVDFCKSKAEIRAGYAPGCGPSLKDPRIIAKIEENKKKHAARINISVDWVLDNYRRIASGSMADYFEIKHTDDGHAYVQINFKKTTADQLRNLKKMKMGKYGLELEIHDPIAALGKIGQYLGMQGASDDDNGNEDRTADSYQIIYHAPLPET
jgi:hypothetical protein